MLMEISVFDILAVLCSFAAVFVSMRAFQLSRKQPNENKVFDEKIRCYSEISKVLNQSINTVITCLEEAQYEKKHKEEEWKEVLLEIEDDLYDAIGNFEDAIYETALFQSREISNQLENYAKLFDVQDFIASYDTPDKLERLSDHLNERYDQLINSMRHDIAFDELDNGLRSRLASSKPIMKRRRRTIDEPQD